MMGESALLVENLGQGDGRIRKLTWQELAELLPNELQVFLDHKYGDRAFWPYCQSMG
jgi:hypothetical protein